MADAERSAPSRAETGASGSGAEVAAVDGAEDTTKNTITQAR